MDNITHTLVGAIIGQTGLKRRTGFGMAALIVGANLPDIDAVYALQGIAASLKMHRGVTHGPLAVLLLPAIVAGMFTAFDRWQSKVGKRPATRLPVRFAWLYGLALLGVLSHIGLDWSNSHGVRLLEPFSHRWFSGDLLFIIDIWIWLGLGVAFWWSRRRERASANWHQPARLAIGLTFAYLLLNGVITHQQVQAAVRSSPDGQIIIADEVAVAFWRREMISGKGNGIWTVGERRYGDVPLDRCDLAKAAKLDPRISAYLFWSRAPFVKRSSNTWILSDARYAGELGEMTVALPSDTCNVDF